MRVVLLSAAVAVLVGCNRNVPAPSGATAPAAGAAPLVKVARPAQKPVKWAIEQPASVLPLEAAPIVARVSGYVKGIAPDTAAINAGLKLPGGQPPVIDLGSVVEAGQLLATVHAPELTAERAEKEAGVARAKAESEQIKRELEVAAAQVAVADEMAKEASAGIARAEADVARWKAELDQVNAQITGGVAEAQTRTVVTKNYEAAKAAKAEAETKVGTAAAAVREKKARQARAGADVETAGARVKVAEAELERVRVMEAYTLVKAPFPGTITARNVHPGHLLQPASGAPGTVLFHLIRADVVRVFADIPEVSAEKAGTGTAASVRVPSLGGREYPATVTRTAGAIDPAAHTLRVEIDLANPDRALKPGVFATVRINAEAADATVLPAGCVLGADETHYVFIVEGGKAVKYRVQLGRADPGTVQVLGRRKATATAGAWERFAGTEQVVDGNLGALSDGIDVRTE